METKLTAYKLGDTRNLTRSTNKLLSQTFEPSSKNDTALVGSVDDDTSTDYNPEDGSQAWLGVVAFLISALSMATIISTIFMSH